MAARSSCSDRVAFALPFGLLHSLSRSIINDTEMQGISCRARCPAHAGATEGGRRMKHRAREMVAEREEDMLLAWLVHQLTLKGTRLIEMGREDNGPHVYVSRPIPSFFFFIQAQQMNFKFQHSIFQTHLLQHATDKCVKFSLFRFLF